MDKRSEICAFLTSRRAKVTPEQAGLPAYGAHRRVTGLRREEVMLLSSAANLSIADEQCVPALTQPSSSEITRGKER